jgi:hypothetical protein
MRGPGGSHVFTKHVDESNAIPQGKCNPFPGRNFRRKKSGPELAEVTDCRVTKAPSTALCAVPMVLGFDNLAWTAVFNDSAGTVPTWRNGN